MSADLNTEITFRGSKEELCAFISVLKLFETEKKDQYNAERNCAYIEWVELNNGQKTVRLEKLDADGIRAFVEGTDTLLVSALGPWGAFSELGDVGLFEKLAEAAPSASFEGTISGFVTGADVGLQAELMDGKVHFSELYFPDDERPDFDEEDEDEYEEAIEELEEEFTKIYTYDPVTKEYEGLFEYAEDCTDKTFVITGKLQFFENREAFSEHIQELGGKVTGSISSKTDFLICNDTASTSSKMKKAKELGIEVITEEEFIRRFGGPDEFELDENDEEEWDEGKNDGALSASDKKDNAASHDTENVIRCAFCDSVSAKSDILKKRAPDGTVCFVCRECCTAYDLNDWETLDDE